MATSQDNNGLFIPERDKKVFSVADIERWYKNIFIELKRGNYSQSAVKIISDPRNYYGKLLNPHTQSFYLNHFAPALTRATNCIITRAENTRKTGLEIGAGCGNQALLFSLLGNTVYAVDIRADVCEIIQKRRSFYEESSGQRPDIRIINNDIFEVDLQALPTLDFVDFQFSFNDIRCQADLIRLVMKRMSRGGVWIMHEGNNTSIYNRYFRQRPERFPPGKVRNLLQENGLHVTYFRGGYVLPPVFWNMLSRKILAPIDRYLAQYMSLSNSYQLIGIKQD